MLITTELKYVIPRPAEMKPLTEDQVYNNVLPDQGYRTPYGLVGDEYGAMVVEGNGRIRTETCFSATSSTRYPTRGHTATPRTEPGSQW